MNKITRDVGVAALRAMRQSIDKNLEIFVAEYVEMRHTIQAQATRIKELEASLDNAHAQLRAALSSRVPPPTDRGTVTRLTVAIAHHLDNDRPAIAKQLAIALNQLEGENYGHRDVPHAARRSRARPQADTQTVRCIGTPYLFD